MCETRQKTHMGGCQTYGPFLDPYYNTAPERDHNFDNHPHSFGTDAEVGGESLGIRV